MTDEETDGRHLRGRRRRSLLVDAALTVVARDGATAVTHASVASAAGLGRSAVSHHFGSIDDLLAAALRSATEQLVLDMPSPGAGDDVSWFAAELVRMFGAHRDRVAAGYELYLLAARQPALRPAVEEWIGLLAELAGRHTTDPDRARLCATAVDGYFLHHLARATEPTADELDRLLRAAIG